MSEPAIPEPDYDDPKEVWAFFGLTFNAAQVLEQGLVNLAVAARIGGNQKITGAVIDQLYDQVGRDTFGRVLTFIRETVTIPHHLDAELTKALGHRNYLAHKFFVTHDRDFLTPGGRKVMIEELIRILRFLKQTDHEFDPIWKKAWHDLGVTQDFIDRELEKIGVRPR